MDLLTHLSLPLTVAVVLRPRWFVSNPPLLVLGGFGVLSDFDKFLGSPGLLHSLVTLVPICLAIVLAERVIRSEYRYSILIVALIGSHLVLDVFDGGPVPLLYPFVEQGIGLQYPARTVFGVDPAGIAVRGPVVTGRVVAPRPGRNAYGFVTGYGVVNVGVLAVVYLRYYALDRAWLTGSEGHDTSERE